MPESFSIKASVVSRGKREGSTRKKSIVVPSLLGRGEKKEREQHNNGERKRRKG